MFKKFTWKQISAAAVLGVLLAFLTITIIEQVYATTQTVNVTMTRSSLRGINWSTFKGTFVNTQDTMNCPVTVSGFAIHDPVLANVIIRTQRPGGAANNPISIAVRLQTSMDGINWESNSIGVDSTTWANLATDTIGNVYNNAQTMSTHGFWVSDSVGWWPYNRVQVFGRAANTIGEKFTLDFIEQ